MSVNPGFGGQTFIPRSESKVREVRALLDRAGNRADVEIDGGIDQPERRARRRGRRPHHRRRLRDLPRAGSRARHARAQGRGARRRHVDCGTLTPQASDHSRCAFATQRPTRWAWCITRTIFVWFEVGAHRPAARLRLELSRDGSRRDCIAGHRSALRLQTVGAVRRRARDAHDGNDDVARARAVRLRDRAARGRHARLRPGTRCTPPLDRDGRPCRLPERVQEPVRSEGARHRRRRVHRIDARRAPSR